MTSLIHIDSIVVKPRRQRKKFDQATINELAESMQTSTGLLHALVVRPEVSGTVLVAGERRLRALRDIYALGGQIRYNGEPVPTGMVPCTNLGTLSALEAWEAELVENIQREDLDWQDRAAATAELMELRTLQAEEAGRPAPRTADIAREIHGQKAADKADGDLGALATHVRDQVIVSRFLDDPEVAGAASVKEAMKVLKKKEEVKRRTELAAAIGATFTSEAHRLLNEDSLVWLAAAPPSSFEIILTDPPYGMDAHEFGNSGSASAGAHFYKDSYEEWQRIMQVFPQESFRVAAPSAHAYVFCDIDRFAELRRRMSEAGWKVHRTPIVWYNPDGFRVPWPSAGPQRKYELILFAVKGERNVTVIKGDVIEARKDAAQGHPAQKPVSLLRDLLTRSARPGDRVLDPFVGSGSTLEACNEMKLACTALELDPAMYALAMERVEGFSQQQDLLKELQ